MGRGWLYWMIGGGFPRRRRRRSAGNKVDDDTSSPGCMCAVFHLFDLQHQIHLPINHQHSLPTFLQQESTSSKGVEAPRNSLELEEPPPPKQQENLNFPTGIQIKTRTSVSASECSMDSPGIKTPNLVARLMGLDLLPEQQPDSPSSTISISKIQTKSHLNQTSTRRSNRCFYDDDIKVGARSLSETSRIEYHRLSLQIHKDNTNEELSRTSRTRFRQDENTSPSHYARQIVKQVKESVSRRVGLDITNINRDEIRRDQNLLKISKKNSSSPKLANLDNKRNRPVVETAVKSPRNSTSSDTNQSKPKHPTKTDQENKCNKTGKRLSPRTSDQAIRSKKVEAFVRSPAVNRVKLTDKNSKKAPLSNELLHLSGPTILPVKKDPSPPATKLPQKQAQVSDALSSKRNTQLSCNTSRSYKQLPLQQLNSDKIFTIPENVPPDSTNGCATTSAAAEYRCYINKILKRAGIIDKLTPLTLGKWHTPSHPLDPSIFYYLELFHPAAAPSTSAAAAVLNRRCNRKLIFQLVDELLVDILRPHLDYKPWFSPVTGSNNQFALVDELCKKIEGFPATDCQVLEDIDSLIDGDLRKPALNGYFEEEGDGLVSEVAGEIVERLVSETVAMVVVEDVRTGRQSGWMSRGVGESAREEMPLMGVCGNHPRRQHVY